ncbi:MAG: class I SAM-dependent methyltransferase [Fidelibacterota bacterium]|nr:MAG: class I SAM-dependent methyltransferase [Candidatus Neomarinimicrobiota bacterium]
MTDWKRYWATHPLQTGAQNYLEQVGKTVHGEPIPDSVLHHIVADIAHHLDLHQGDILLDLCCGNGLLTHHLAGHCHRVIGVDYSEPLVNIAKRDHQPENVIYLHASILDLEADSFPATEPFTKILMYECLQHFKPRDILKILHLVGSVSSASSVTLIGSIPDGNRRNHFYNTPKRRLAAFLRRLVGKDAIGTWWRYAEIAQVASEMGYGCRFVEQARQLHTAHYRFDMLLNRNPLRESDQ